MQVLWKPLQKKPCPPPAKEDTSLNEFPTMANSGASGTSVTAAPDIEKAVGPLGKGRA